MPEFIDHSNADAGDAIRASLARKLEPGMGGHQPGSPPAIPDHVLLDCIGAGSYGEVWRARNTLGTLRAVKIVYRSRFEDDRPYQREFNGILKYEPVSRRHEGLVQVLHVGLNENAGYFYYVMELADDAGTDADPTKPGQYRPGTLRSNLAGRQRLPPVDAAGLVHRLADALAYLHSQGLVHRDIKPSNVIFVGGVPKLADIGLVAGAGDSLSFVGTEGFIPPEGPGAPQADIYGLGKVLYELAIGLDRLDFPQLPPQILNAPDGEALLELNEVITRACEPDPRLRYADVTEMDQDLKLFLAGHSLREARKFERHLVWLKRFALVACGLLALAVVVVWSAQVNERHSRERVRVETALRERAEAAEMSAHQELYGASLGQARATVRSVEMGQRINTLDAIRRAAAITNSVELRREAFAALTLPDLRFETEIPLVSGIMTGVMSPDFKSVALCRGTDATEVRAIAGERLLATLPPTTNLPAFTAEWSPDGRYLLVKRYEHRQSDFAEFEIWDVAAKKLILALENRPVGAVAFHPSQPWLITQDAQNHARVWNLENTNQVAQLRFEGVPFHLRYSPDGKRILAIYRAAGGWTAVVREANSDKAISSALVGERMSAVNWDPKDRWIALGDRLGGAHLLEPRTGQISSLARHRTGVVTAVFSPDGDFIFTGGFEEEIVCSNLRRGERAMTIGLQSSGMQFCQDGRHCAILTGSTLTVYAFERPAGVQEWVVPDLRQMHWGAFSPNGNYLAVGGREHIGVWRWRGQSAPAVIGLGDDAHPFFNGDSSELFAYWNNAIGCWHLDAAAGPDEPIQLQPRLIPKTRRLYSALLITNTLVITGEGGVELRPAADSDASRGILHNESAGLGCAAPNHRWLLLRSEWEPWVEALEIAPWRYAKRILTGADVMNFAFTPQSDEVAVATRQGIEFFAPKTWKPTRKLPMPMDRYASVIFTPDGHNFWAVKDLQNATLYDTKTLSELLPLPRGMIPLAYSPDGKHLAISMDPDRLQIWDIAELRKSLKDAGVDWADP